MNQQRGGSLLGQGLYGCAFEPPLKCKNQIGVLKGRKVGKVTSEFDADWELTISEQLRKLKGSDQYFVLLDTSCTPKPRTNQKNSSLKKCEPLEGIRLPDMKQVIMPFGGKPLRQILRSIEAVDYFELCTHLLEAGALLLMAKVVHSDLHMLNVLVDSNKTLRLIDFGLAWSPSMLTLANLHMLDRVFAPEITQQTPETSILFGFKEGMDMEIMLAQIEDKKVPLQMLYQLTGRSVESQMNDLRIFLKESRSFREQNWFSFYNIYWSKQDSWAIGAILLSLFVDMSMDPRFEESSEVQNKTRLVLDVCSGLLRTDPGKRLDAIQALAQWAPESDILNLADVQEWLQKQNQLKAQLERRA